MPVLEFYVLESLSFTINFNSDDSRWRRYQGSHRDVAPLGKGQSVLSIKVVVMGEFDGDQMMNSGKCGGRRRSGGVVSGG